MPEQVSATETRDSRGKAAAFLLGMAAALVTAWLCSRAFCALTAQLGLQLPPFTCGSNFGLPFLIFFVTVWPLYVFLWVLLFRRPR